MLGDYRSLTHNSSVPEAATRNMARRLKLLSRTAGSRCIRPGADLFA
jgi:hypothetical protein